MENQVTQRSTALEPELQDLMGVVKNLAQQAEGDTFALLALLRVLEQLHREIFEGAFQDSLPTTRHGLYNLLKDIELEGGWPHIPRMKIQQLMVNCLENTASGELQP
ncbi:hypothetical protein [Alkalinema sp. FACHB-956]|uniref:hypothetical protein n=1 Tax=Alkalinema sp. FACHB-956 TaxID=2692768 RepID=UPI0016864D82|nr:hypothetical protein [Alkalinema sp. FACHB-956]MBD2326621.1 hypothetical protein [Alkalinema sp. FACHB-956]